MRTTLVIAFLSLVIIITHASTLDNFLESHRRYRQLFVTPPSSMTDHRRGNTGQYKQITSSDENMRKNIGEPPRRTTSVFLSSSSGSIGTASPTSTIKYVQLRQAGTTPGDAASTTGGDPFPSTTNQQYSLSTSRQFASRSTQFDFQESTSPVFRQDTGTTAMGGDTLTVRQNIETSKTSNAPSLTHTELPNFTSTYSITPTEPTSKGSSLEEVDDGKGKEKEVNGIKGDDGRGDDDASADGKQKTDDAEQRSALIRLPSRDAQVIFLADDPEAAARIPGLLTKLQEHSSRNKPNPEIFPHSRRSPSVPNPSPIRYTSIPRITVPDSEYTLIDLHKTYDDQNINTGGTEGGQTVEMNGQTEPSVISEGRNNILEEEAGTSRHHPGFGSHRLGGPPPFRRPFGQSGTGGSGGSSVISKEAGSYHSFPSSSFSRSRTSTALTRPAMNMTRVTHIEAECQDDFMRIHTQFNGSFGGLIYSAGYAYDRDCIYVNGSGRILYDFHVQLNRCGTLGGNEKGEIDIRGRPTQKNMMWNTLTVQYNPLIEEEWDEHFKVTCEYGYDFWKTVTFPFLDVEVQTGNPVVFTLTPPECHMEIRYGYGTSGQRINGPVRVGDPLTLVIYMRSELDGFDIVVSDCFAHNGGNKRISLIDHYGCPVDEKLISHFEGTRSDDGHFETQVYAFMKTFRFTGSPALYIECDVRMCHGECPPQPCHWKRTTRERRSLPSSASSGGGASNVSESLNLFQALRVLRDEDPSPGGTAPQQGLVEGSVCLKNGTFSAAAGAVTALIGLLTVACVVMCLRARRQKKIEKSSTPSKPAIIPAYKSDFVPPSKRRLE